MPPSTTIWSPALRPSAMSYWSPVRIAQGHVLPREAAVGLGQVDKRQVFIVAQNRRNRDQQPGAFLAGLDQHAHIHLLLEEIARIVDHHPHGHRAGVGIHQRRDVVHLFRKRSSNRCRSSTSAESPRLTDARSEPKTCAMTQTRDKVGHRKARRGARLEQFSRGDQFLHHGPGDRRANHALGRAKPAGPA